MTTWIVLYGCFDSLFLDENIFHIYPIITIFDQLFVFIRLTFLYNCFKPPKGFFGDLFSCYWCFILRSKCLGRIAGKTLLGRAGIENIGMWIISMIDCQTRKMSRKSTSTATNHKQFNNLLIDWSQAKNMKGRRSKSKKEGRFFRLFLNIILPLLFCLLLTSFCHFE